MQDKTHEYKIKIMNNLFIDINIVISYTEFKHLFYNEGKKPTYFKKLDSY